MRGDVPSSILNRALASNRVLERFVGGIFSTLMAPYAPIGVAVLPMVVPGLSGRKELVESILGSIGDATMIDTSAGSVPVRSPG